MKYILLLAILTFNTLWATDSQLSFKNRDPEYTEIYEPLKEWLHERVEENKEAKELIDLALEAGDIEVLFRYQESHLHAVCWAPGERRIYLNIKYLHDAEYNSETKTKWKNDLFFFAISETYDRNITGVYYMMLQGLIMELSNAANKPLNNCNFSDFPDAEAYAQFIERAEFISRKTQLSVTDYGKEHCKWDKEFLKHSLMDQFVLKNQIEEYMAETITNNKFHYKTLIDSYNKNGWSNKINYYLRKFCKCLN